MAATGNTTASGTRGNGQKTPLVWRVVVGIVIFVAVLFALGMLIRAFGGVYGQEFSPDTFTRRDYVYYQIPLLGIQVTPVYRWPDTNALELHLTGKKLVPKSAAKKPRWDIVAITTAGSPTGSPGDANLLCSYLDTHDDEGVLVWLDWTKKHPKLAKTLWPAVAQVARDDRYAAVPDMIEAAMRAETPESLQQELERIRTEAESLKKP